MALFHEEQHLVKKHDISHRGDWGRGFQDDTSHTRGMAKCHLLGDVPTHGAAQYVRVGYAQLVHQGSHIISHDRYAPIFGHGTSARVAVVDKNGFTLLGKDRVLERPAPTVGRQTCDENQGVSLTVYLVIQIYAILKKYVLSLAQL